MKILQKLKMIWNFQTIEIFCWYFCELSRWCRTLASAFIILELYSISVEVKLVRVITFFKYRYFFFLHWTGSTLVFRVLKETYSICFSFFFLRRNSNDPWTPWILYTIKSSGTRLEFPIDQSCLKRLVVDLFF